jgi:glycosyltransferase involved in cell wall biosynthesis
MGTDRRVTVIIPTLANRHAKLYDAIQSVQLQSFTDWELLVIPNGPDDWLLDWIPRCGQVIPLGRPHPTPGHWNRVLGGLLAETPLIAYLDDDNTWRPDHLELLVAALDAAPEAGFAFSQMLTPHGVFFDGQLRPGQTVGHVDSSVLVHRAELLTEVATWDPHRAREVLPLDPNATYAMDGCLVDLWLQAGVGFRFVPEVTVDYSQTGYWVDGGGVGAA